MSIENKVRRKTTWEKSLPSKNGHWEKYESEYQPSPCLTHSKNISHVGECLLCESLGENVSIFLYIWVILQGYHLITHQALDVVHVYLNVFSPLSLHWIYGNIYFTFIFTPNDYGWIKCKSKFPKNTLQPHTLYSCIHYSSVLGLNWREGYGVMFLAWPAYGTMCKHEYIT